MTLTFRAYDASRCGYPRNRIPVTPLLELSALGSPTSARYPSAFSEASAPVFARGRYALFHALRRLGVGEAHSVMVPAYHCRTMIDPVVHAGAEVALFTLNADLSPDLAGLASTAGSTARPVKALLLPHYFGFPQDIAPVAAFCHERGIALIEDCCHAYYGSWHGRPLGTWGDCAIASPNKFFACDDGGSFFAPGPQPTVRLRSPPLIDELRAVYHSAEGLWAQRQRRFGADGLRDLAPRFERVREQFPRWSGETEEHAGTSLSHLYQSGLDTASALAWSRGLMRWSDADKLCELRRANFSALLAGVRELPHCRPLFSALPEGVVPYMFPLLIEQPEHRFHWLKHLGVPMYRWDELAISDCATSNRYRLNLVHLPCHQSMRPDDLAWLLRALAHAMNAQPASEGAP